MFCSDHANWNKTHVKSYNKTNNLNDDFASNSIMTLVSPSDSHIEIVMHGVNELSCILGYVCKIIFVATTSKETLSIEKR